VSVTYQLSRRDVFRLVNNYIGVYAGYLGDFSYRTHEEFYPQYCNLDINPSTIGGTTRERFIHILESSPAQQQAQIIRGVLTKYPIGSADGRTQGEYDHFSAVAGRLEGNVVAPPEPQSTREVVLEALRDAETSIRDGHPASAVDRVHTAFHGHLRALCDRHALSVPDQATVNQLFNALRAGAPGLQPQGPRASDITRVLRSAGAILDALGTLRNQATLAHPNEDLLPPAEALLAVNVARSLLSYLDAKLGT
jgi:hypothetical protein